MKREYLFSKLNDSTRRMASLVGAMLLGAFVPQAHVLESLIPFLVFFMLLMAFVNTAFDKDSVKLSHILIVIAMPCIALSAFYIVLFFWSNDLAQTAFLIGMTPTATAAIVITNMLGRRGDYVATSMILTNIFSAISLPFLAKIIAPHANIQINLGHLLLHAGSMIGGALILSRLILMLPPKKVEFVRKGKNLSFIAWMIVLFLVVSRCSHFIRTTDIATGKILSVLVLSAVMCAIHFSLGYVLGEKHFSRECSQSLGQKNTMFTLWIALNFFSPFVALGPAFYVICHNLFNSYQIGRTKSERDNTAF